MNEVLRLSKNISNNVITLKNLTKTYPSGVVALDNVNLNITQNDFTSVIGPSGAGKSTLLRCINRLVSPSFGSISLNGEEITKAGGRRLLKVRRKIGMIFQQFHLVKRISVIENVLVGRLKFHNSPLAYGASLAGIFSAKEKQIAFECLKQVGIERHAFHRADTLSGGQQQRVAIARVLAQNPDVILADEPVASLDPRSSDIVMELLYKIHEERKIPVMVNLHQLDIARNYSRKIVALKDGNVVFEGSSKSLDIDAVENIYGHVPSELRFKKVSNL